MQSNESGLTSKEAKAKLAQFGPNALPEKPPSSSISIFLNQLKSPLVYVLLAAALVTTLLGDYSDSIIIGIAVLLNTILGFVQEKRAGEALSALKKLVTNQAEVIRDRVTIKIPASDIVPGDIVQLRQGYRVPADGEILSSNRFFVDEAILTGESIPVEKTLKKEVFMGTIVSGGTALMRITATGKETQIGAIAKDIQEPTEDTPLHRQLSAFSKTLVIIVLSLTTFVFVLGIVTNRSWVEMLSTAVALSVSAIPEGLLIGMTVVLAIGMQRILKRQGLVRRLSSAETLGGVTIICLDKTGTLTEGKMSVVSAHGDEDAMAIQMLVANDMDDPIVLAAHAWASEKMINAKLPMLNEEKKNSRIDSLPFSSEDRFFAALNKGEKNKNRLYVSGAPEFVLSWAKTNQELRTNNEKLINNLTEKGYRLVALAHKDVPEKTTKITNDMVKSGLTFSGILAFSDPVRPGVGLSLSKAQKAGIKLMVITGDYPKTAASIMKELGIKIGLTEIMTGEELRKLDVRELTKKLTSIKLFARTTPDQKLKIVDALKKNGEVVAMMGDGVNDAPALTKADIGIVVGDATDVARESADLVLLDSRFETVIAAIEEGRGMYSNVRKIIMYLMSTAFNEIVAVAGALFLGLPIPISTAQILWINVVSDGLPNMALTVEPKKEGSMEEPPRSPREPLVTRWMKFLIAIVSIVSGISALALFAYVYRSTGDEILARSVAFIALGSNSLVYVFSIRTLLSPFWSEKFTANKWLLLAVAAGTFLQFLPFMVPSLRTFFAVVVPSTYYWVLIVIVTISVFTIIEILKFIIRKMSPKLFTKTLH